jgi:formate dehydrogenase subunit delta
LANQITLFFESQPERGVAIAGIQDHLKRFWDPCMRDGIIDHLEAGGDGLLDPARAAVMRLAADGKAVGA